MHLDDAREVAGRIVTLLAPACAEIVVAGSIRRERPDVRDIELVARSLPGAPRPTFGDRTPAPSHLEACIITALVDKALRLDPGNRKNGPKYKRFLDASGIGVDLFIADEQNWGNVLTIRTGDSDFSHRLVTQRGFGGCMPEDLRQDGGYLWRYAGHEGLERERIPCPTEESFFAALGIAEIPEPPTRDAGLARRLAATLAGSVGR
jgi:DNA polymerase/3'-5' exonuclease PolX